MHRTETTAAFASPPLVQWRSVFGAGVIGLALMALVTVLWLALAYGSDMEQVSANLRWYIGGTAIGSMFVAGALAGWLSGVHGAAPGMFNGLTVWGLVLIIGLAVGVPSMMNLIGTGTTDGSTVRFGEEAAWPVFWSLLIGFGAAAIGGMIGGLIPKPMRTEVMVQTTEDEDLLDDDATIEQHRAAS